MGPLSICVTKNSNFALGLANSSLRPRINVFLSTLIFGIDLVQREVGSGEAARVCDGRGALNVTRVRRLTTQKLFGEETLAPSVSFSLFPVNLTHSLRQTSLNDQNVVSYLRSLTPGSARV